MQTRTLVERLDISPLVAPGRKFHIYLDRYFHGCIEESGAIWHVSLHRNDYGTYPSEDEARQAVTLWFRGLDIEPWEAD